MKLRRKTPQFYMSTFPAWEIIKYIFGSKYVSLGTFFFLSQVLTFDKIPRLGVLEM